MRLLGLAAICLLAAAQSSRVTDSFISGEDAGYVDSAVCAGCHHEIAGKFAQTGMGRSFYRIAPETIVEDFQRNNTCYHQPSDRHYRMYERDGRYYQRRHQLAADGRERNVVEMEIHYVLGSGNHARTYLHRTASGQLVQLPIGWYAERGGFWAMNPGYDRTDHMDFRRKIDRECFFCHNAYPRLAPDTNPGERALTIVGAVPEGIDCQRCHGPGRRHVELAQAGESAAAVRQAVVNPTRLSSERRLEVCLQCHLQSTSHRLPYSIRKYGRGYFSYRAGEPLGDYVIHFERKTAPGQEAPFEIAHSAYRLLKSACFKASKGSLTCTTCHNPHEASHGSRSMRDYTKICGNCHGVSLPRLIATGKHTASEACVDCHMPKRRTDDAVHVVMTDHALSRRLPAGDPLAPRREVHDTDETSYKGEVALLYPWQANPAADTSLYVDLAQVIDGSNLQAGIARLEKSLSGPRPQTQFFVELANAYARAGLKGKALPWYEKALRHQPESSSIRVNYAMALSAMGKVAEAIYVLEPARTRPRPDASALNALGSAYLAVGRTQDAIAVLERATSVDPEIPEAYVNLGAALARNGARTEAMDALQTAIRLAPDFAPAHNNLANLLSEVRDFPEAHRAFAEALRLRPDYAEAHYNYGRSLAAAGMLEPAKREFGAALKLQPKLAPASVSLGLVLMQQDRIEEAIVNFRHALGTEPALTTARFNLALALKRQGRNALAREQFQAILRSAPEDHEAHYHLGMILLGEGAKAAAMQHLEKARRSHNQGLRSAASDAIDRASTP